MYSNLALAIMYFEICTAIVFDDITIVLPVSGNLSAKWTAMSPYGSHMTSRNFSVMCFLAIL